jgi:N-acyl-D-amino-acid deacylase
MFEGGLTPFFSRLKDQAARERLIQEFRERQPEWPQWETGTWCDKAYSPEIGWSHHRLYGFRNVNLRRYEGVNLEAIAEDLGKDPFEALFELTLAEQGRLYYTSGFHDDEGFDMVLGAFLRLPNMSFMTDAVGIGRRAQHPSHYGTFPRFLGRHAREWETFPLAEAIRKCTSLPARQFGLKDRGVIRENAWADLVVFDPGTVRDTASFAAPYQYPQGIETVIVNGVPVWNAGEYRVDERAGVVLRSNKQT